ncbi:MAG: lasso peptide biosynthesis B2 protein [Calditrichia bacterium]
MMQSIQKFVRLDRREKHVVLRAFWLLLIYPILRRKLTMPQLVAFYSNAKVGALNGVLPERLLALVQTLLRIRIRPLHPNCMKQSLVMYHFLRSENYPVSLIFGVAKTADGEIDGHAWICLNDEPFGEVDDPLSKFTVTLRYPAIESRSDIAENTARKMPAR